MVTTLPEVRGVNLDPQTRCEHYHGPTDIIAIKMKCCGVYYACKDCHNALADHQIEVWPEREWDQPAILCGACGAGVDHPSIYAERKSLPGLSGSNSIPDAATTIIFISRSSRAAEPQ